jgi:hypothetical protein
MGFGPTDLDIYVHLRNMLDALQIRALEYCSSPEDELERHARVVEMRHALAGNVVLPTLVRLFSGCPSCGDGEHCEGGVCVPDTAYSGVPADDEQPLEDD